MSFMASLRRDLINRAMRVSMLATSTRLQSATTKNWMSQVHTSTVCCNTTVKKKFGVTVTEATSRQDHNSSPIVVILGWNSSKDKHLAKYSELFEKKNYSTIRVTANPFTTIFRSGSKAKQISHYVLDTMKEIRCENRPVFFYVFSNGGCILFFHILEALTRPGTEFDNTYKIRGTIFDSCPINTNIEIVKIVQESVTDTFRNPLVKSILWRILGILTPLVIRFNPDSERFLPVLEKSPLKCPQLVLYSKADKIAPYKTIDKYVEARKQQGFDVRAKCWEHSQHVSHFRENTEEYVKLLNEFNEHCFVKK